MSCYLQDELGPIARPAGLTVLTVEEDRVTAVTRFMDPAVYGSFGFAPTLPGRWMSASHRGPTHLLPAER